jgi:hypothetical protein
MSRVTNSKRTDRIPSDQGKNPGFEEGKFIDANKTVKIATVNGKKY